MQDLRTYLQDGACDLSKAALAYLQWQIGDGIEESWSNEFSRYLAEPRIARWENCREQGYVIVLRSYHYKKQLNIIFFEHRNSDNICAVEWEQLTINTPTIETAEFGNIYKDKYDVSHRVSYNQAYEMAEWIYNRLVDFWAETKEKGE